MRHWLFSICCLVLCASAWADPLTSSQPSSSATPPPPLIEHSGSAHFFALAPFKAKYKVYRNGTEVGKATRTLYTSSDGRLYFSSESRLKWFILSDYRKEQSWLRMEDGRVLPLEYQYDRTGTGPDRFSHLIFNKEQQSIQELKESYPLKTEWQEGLLDHLSYQLQLKLDVAQGNADLAYALVYKGKLKNYGFEIIGEEIMNLPIGQIKTLKLKRLRKNNSSRETYIWLSKEHDYALARLRQTKDGKEQADLQLAGYEYLNTNPN